MKKKPYEQPKMDIIEVKAADIICTSGQLEQYQDGNTDEWYTL